MKINEKLILNYMWFNKLTKGAFCKKCGISLSVLNKMLNNQHTYNVVAIYKVAMVMNVHVHNLFVNE